MKPCEAAFGLAQPEDKEELLDFINLVFSHAHCPHDFPTLLPKLYKPDLLEPQCHYVAKENGRIKALVGSYPVTQKVLGETLSVRTVGAVSVHPYARGRGYMKRLMHDAVEDMRAQGVDISWLGGLRQRYQYYGYETGGQTLRFLITSTNLRHCFGTGYQPRCTLHPVAEGDPVMEDMRALYETQPVHALRPAERFYVTLRNWNSRVLVLRLEETFAGYLVLAQGGDGVSELLLTDPSLLPDAIAALLASPWAKQEVWFTAFPYEAARIRSLQALCETYRVEQVENLQVFSFERVVRAFFQLKAAAETLPDGAMTFALNGEKLALECEDGQVSVTPLAADEECDLSLSHHEAVSLLFGAATAFCRPELPSFAKVWFPLPVMLQSPDQA